MAEGQESGDERSFDEVLLAALSRMESDGADGLDAICGAHPTHADELRRRVRLLEEAGLVAGSGEAGPDFPERLGDFHLLECLGAGGMGVVYLAEQESLGRRVALKLIRPEHMYFPGARTRFAREVNAVARLAHPSIVPVHVVGEESGIPYFAMEYVHGATLERVIAAARELGAGERSGADLLRIVRGGREGGDEPAPEEVAGFGGSWVDAAVWIARELAQALEHAHQRGVLHRDVKPSNVMITPGGRVLLLDFGLASSEGSDALTRTGSGLGSLPYMSPEQVRGDMRSVGPGTDVWGLGATLYELITLNRPFDAATTEPLRAQILDARPRRPRESVPTASGDLEAVISVALAPEIERRYRAAADMARDLTRLLERRPVEARAAGPWLQLVRWTQRNKGAAAAIGLGMTVVTVGPILFGLQQQRLTAKTEIQRQRADAARALADEQRELADEQRGRAEANLMKAVEAVDTMLRKVGDQRLASVPQTEQVRKELLAAARRFYAELGQASVEESLGIRRLRARVGISMTVLDHVLGNRELAEQGFREHAQEFEELLATASDPTLDSDMLGRTLAGYAGLLIEAGRLEEAGEVLDRAEEVSAGMGDGASAVSTKIHVLHERSRLHYSAGAVEEALEATDRAARIGEDYLADHPGDLVVVHRLANVLHESGRVMLSIDPLGSIEQSRAALELWEQILEKERWDMIVRNNFCETSANLGQALSLAGRPEESLEVLETAIDVAHRLIADFPTVTAYRRTLNLLRLNAANQLAALGRVDESLEFQLLAIEQMEDLVADEPGNVVHTHRLGAALNNHAANLQDLGRIEESIEPLERAIECHRRAVAAQPNSPPYRYHLGVALMNYAGIEGHRGAFERSFELLDEALPLLKFDSTAQRYLAFQWMAVSEFVGAADDLDEAEREELTEWCHDSAVEALKAAVDNGYGNAADLGADPAWDPIRGRDDFQALAERIGDL